MILVITGPTCSGKSSDALSLAKKINAEIINGDAFQCYKEMNIGVAKPSKEDFKEVPHHLYDILSVNEPYSIYDYQQNLRKKLALLDKQGKNIIIVGGSGLYIRSALYDYEFNDEKAVDMSSYESMTNKELHDFLISIDPVDAQKIHENNRKRVLRAIEIYLQSGQTKSQLLEKQEHKPIYDVLFFVKDLDRDELYNRINQRVDDMINEGLVDEVKNIISTFGTDSQAMQAIGYKEIVPYLDGEIALDEAVENIKKHTRNYAKRQMTFIRHQFPVIFYKDIDDLYEKILDNSKN